MEKIVVKKVDRNQEWLDSFQKARKATRLSQWINLIVMSLFFVFFTGVAILTKKYKSKYELDKKIAQLEAQVHEVLTPVRSVVDQSKGPLALWADDLESAIKKDEMGILGSIFANEMSPEGLRQTDQKILSQWVWPLQSSIDATEKLVSTLGQETQGIVSSIAMYVFWGSLVCSIITFLATVTFFLPTSHLLRKSNPQKAPKYFSHSK
jgi:hypothetical protein